jgi:hypothetical protein
MSLSFMEFAERVHASPEISARQSNPFRIASQSTFFLNNECGRPAGGATPDNSTHLRVVDGFLAGIPSERRLRGWSPAEGEGDDQAGGWSDAVRAKMPEGNIACIIVLEEDVNSAWLMCAIIPQATKEAQDGDGDDEGGEGEGAKKIKPTHTRVVRSQIDKDALAALRAGDNLSPLPALAQTTRK